MNIAMDSGGKAVGQRVQVFWEGDDAWFEGVVAEYSEENGYFVHYDDGEQQWEAANPEAMRFLDVDELPVHDAAVDDGGGGGDNEPEDLSRGGDAEKWSAEPPPPDEQEQEDAYSDEYAEDDDHDQDSDDVRRDRNEEANAEDHAANSDPEDDAKNELMPSSPTPEQAQSSTAKPSPHNSVRSRSKRGNAHHIHDGVFFRDAESLHEMKMAMQREKKTLLAEHDRLQRELDAGEEQSAKLKHELRDLKATATLQTLTDAASVPRNAASWAARVTQQRLLNQEQRQSLVAKQRAETDKITELHRTQQQRDLLQQRLNRVPIREKTTLVDVQLAIAEVMAEKRLLEAEVTEKIKQERQKRVNEMRRSSATSTSSATAASGSERIALEKELRTLDHVVARLRGEIDDSKLLLQREQARVAPLVARRQRLQVALREYEASQVLLRSAFLRMDSNGTGRVSVAAAVATLTALAPSDTNQDLVNKQLERLLYEEGRAAGGDSVGGEAATLDLASFTRCFMHLYGAAR